MGLSLVMADRVSDDHDEERALGERAVRSRPLREPENDERVQGFPGAARSG